MTSWPRILVLFFMTVLLAACQSSPVVKLYDGAERPVSQIAVVQIPETLDIISINGRDPSGINSSLMGSYRELHLSAGQYEIIAFYREIWEPDSTSTHVVLRSEPAIFTVEGRPGGRYVLEYGKPGNVDDARELAADFRGWTRDITSGQRIPTEPSGLARPGLLSNVNIGGIAPVPASEVVMPVPTTSPSATTPAMPTPVGHASGNTDGGAYLDMLKAQWSQASAEERRAFLRWVAE